VKTDILIAGVGGQGILLAADLIGETAVRNGLKALGAETHGMAQRGGSVVSHLRIGDIHAPLIPRGSADFMLAFEPAEALRNASFLGERSISVVNLTPVIPVLARKGDKKYPKVERIIDELLEYSEVVPINATGIAEELGAQLVTNIVMLGTLSAMRGFPLKEKALKDTIKERVPPKTIELNLKAFEMGRKEGADYLK